MAVWQILLMETETQFSHRQGHNMVDMEPAVRIGKHKKINSGRTAENRKNTSGMDVMYLHHHCPEIKKTV